MEISNAWFCKNLRQIYVGFIALFFDKKSSDAVTKVWQCFFPVNLPDIERKFLYRLRCQFSKDLSISLLLENKLSVHEVKKEALEV
jgi:hypothetical protein